MNWNIRNRILELRKPLIMGILNLTPDSFSDGGECQDFEHALSKAEGLIREGADMLDVGAESTRPGAGAVNLEEERARLLPFLKRLRRRTDIPISIDTTKPAIAEECLLEGADIINDVSGLKESGPEMARTVRDFGAGLILMHRRGTPATMQKLAVYQNLVDEICGELNQSVQEALRSGVSRDQIVLDPGLGFAKTAEQNFEIMRNLNRFHRFERPLLLGPSRKSFIGTVTGRDVRNRDFGTAAAVAFSVLEGVSIIRVHDAGRMRDVIQVIEAIRGVEYVRTF